MRTKRRFFSAIGLVVLGCCLEFGALCAAIPGTPDPEFAAGLDENDWPEGLSQGPDGLVYALIDRQHNKPDSRLELVRYRTDGIIDKTFRSPPFPDKSMVQQFTVSSEGEIFISGRFPMEDGVQHLLRFRQDGRSNIGFEMVGGYAYEPERVRRSSRGGVWVLGTREDPSESGIARILPSGGFDPSFSVGRKGARLFLSDVWEWSDGRVVVCGAFKKIGDENRWGVAQFLADGQLDPSFVPPQAESGFGPRHYRVIRGLPGGRVLIAGLGQPSYVKRLLPNGSADPTFAATPIDGGVDDIYVEQNGAILLEGSFAAVGGILRHRLARLHPDGTVDSGYLSAVPTSALKVGDMVQEDRLLVGWGDGSAGRFLWRLGRLFGGPAPPLPPQIVRSPMSMSRSVGQYCTLEVVFRSESPAQIQWMQNDVVIPGATNSIYSILGLHVGHSGSYVARVTNSKGTVDSGTALVVVEPPLASPGQVDLTFRPGAGPNGVVTALHVLSDGRIIAGGLFGTFDGQPSPGLARLDSSGRLDREFSSNLTVPNAIWAVAVLQGDIVLAGGYSEPGPKPPPAIVRVLPDGRSDPEFRSSLQSGTQVSSMVVQADGHILTAGTVSSPGAGKRWFIARLLPSGEQDPNFVSNLPDQLGNVRLASTTTGRIFLAGLDVDRTTNRLYRLTRDDGVMDPRLVLEFGYGRIESLLAEDNGSVWMAGDFKRADGDKRQVGRAIIKVSAEGEIAKDSIFQGRFAPPMASSLILDPRGAMLVGASQGGLYRANPNGDTNSVFFTGTDGGIFAMHLSPQGDLYIGGGFSIVSQVACPGIARIYLEDRSQPHMIGPFVTNDGFELEMRSFEGWIYELEVADAAATEEWRSLGVFQGTGEEVRLRDPEPPQAHRIYRVQVRRGGGKTR